MNITGHKTTEMFLRYNTVDDYDAREAMERLSGFLEEKEERDTGKSDTFRRQGLKCKKRGICRWANPLKLLSKLVPEVGIEPTRTRGPGDFESPASTNFTTPAY